MKRSIIANLARGREGDAESARPAEIPAWDDMAEELKPVLRWVPSNAEGPVAPPAMGGPRGTGGGGGAAGRRGRQGR